MKELNYWQQFLNTGRIEDYLKFRETVMPDKSKEEIYGVQKKKFDAAYYVLKDWY